MTSRLMIGHSLSGKLFRYALLTVKDCIGLFTPAILNKINEIVINCGHKIIGKEVVLTGGCDSFVVETDAHFPTDINLLLDALRKIIFIIMALCKENGITGWRKGMFDFKKIKRLHT